MKRKNTFSVYVGCTEFTAHPRSGHPLATLLQLHLLGPRWRLVRVVGVVPGAQIPGIPTAVALLIVTPNR